MISRLSLQARLLILLALLLSILWAGLEIGAGRVAQERADAELREELRATTGLLAAISIPPGMDTETRRALLEAAQRRRRAPLGAPAYELLDGADTVLRSHPFPDFDVPPPPGIATARAGEGMWQVLTVVDVESGGIRRAAMSQAARQDRVRALRSELSAPWTVALPVFSIAVLGSVWIGLRPLRRIERKIAATSPHEPRPLGLDPARMPREIATLARSFDRLAARLARVVSDQRIFASAAGHELRTPLAGARSQLDVLRRAPDRREAATRLGESLAHMERLIAQLLFLARSDTVAASDHPVRVDLAALLHSVGDELDLGSRLAIEGGAGLSGYPDLLRSLVRNLVRNAAQASGDGPVTVQISEAAGHVRVAVLDRGPGIPAADRRAVFEPFRRGGGTRSAGAGLGLTVAQRIAELHGGRIVIEDRQGGGASVTAILEGAPSALDDRSGSSAEGPGRRTGPA